MQRLLTTILLISAIYFNSSATTWDEPWQEDIFKQSDLYVKAKVTRWKGGKGATIKVLDILYSSDKNLDIKGKKININAFTCSTYVVCLVTRI